MKKNKMKTELAILLIAVMIPIAACANSKGERGGNRQGPPPEAIAACENMNEGDSVTFKGRRGESLKATCKSMNGQLAAVPEGHREQ